MDMNTAEALENKPGRKKTRNLSRLFGTICALLLVVCLFLPLFVVTDEYADYLDSYPADYVDETVGLNIHELASVSAVDYGRIYGRIFDGVEGTLYIVITAVLAAAALLTLLFAALNKPVGAIIFDAISYAVFRLMVYDLTDRGVLPGSRWEWSIGYYLLNVVPALMLVIAVWMLVVKLRRKKQITGSTDPEN